MSEPHEGDRPTEQPAGHAPDQPPAQAPVQAPAPQHPGPQHQVPQHSGPYGPPHYPQPGYGPPAYDQHGYPLAGYPPQPYAPQGYPPPGYPPPGYPPPGYPPPGYAPPGNAPQGWTTPGQPQGQYPPVSRPRPPYPHPEPREYHEMYRTWTYSWWRPVVGIVMVPVGMVIVLPLLALPVLLLGVLVQDGSDGYLDSLARAATLQEVTPAGLLYLNVSLGGLILWTWGLIRVLHQMRPRWLSSVVPKLRWRFLMVCLGLSLVALFAQLVVGLLVPQDANPDVTVSVNEFTGTMVAIAVVLLLTTPFQAIGEEYIFRGYLLQATGSLVRRRWVAIVLTALLFATAHLQFDPPLFFDRFMFGIVAAWLVIRTGGLEAGIALHVLNNFLAFGLALLFGDIDSTLDIPDVSWWNVPVTLTQSLVYAVLVAWVAKKMQLQRTTRVPQPAPAQEPPL